MLRFLHGQDGTRDQLHNNNSTIKHKSDRFKDPVFLPAPLPPPPSSYLCVCSIRDFESRLWVVRHDIRIDPRCPTPVTGGLCPARWLRQRRHSAERRTKREECGTTERGNREGTESHTQRTCTRAD
jgi:hypothetical protein